ncbi:MAG: DUF4336 domain-containing protein [Alphaproteobacteria bacterium]|nr:DUF4336 domain-containing protein [Alphaproteobacteria bacterium]
MLQATYPPLDVLKPVVEDLWVVDSGPLAVARIPLPVRMTIIRVDDGMLLHSPTPYDRTLRQAIAELGPIRHLVAPSFAHWIFMREWVAACPDAITWAAPGLRDRRQVRRSGLRLDRDLGGPAWGGIEQCVIPGGGGFREVALLHRPSRTVLLSDLVQNLEPAKLPVMARPLARLLGVTAPDGRAPVYLRAMIRLGGEDAASAVSRVLAWEPERVIFAHGRWFEQDGAAELRRSFRWIVP